MALSRLLMADDYAAIQLPRSAISSNRFTRSSVDGCVLKSLTKPPPEKGLMMNICALAGEPVLMGISRLQVSILRNALASASGVPEKRAPVASAMNSRDREIAI